MTTNNRFNLAFYDNYDGTFSIQDKLYCGENKHLHSLDEIINLLNELNYENEQLKSFKEDVFNKIDMHLRMLPTAVDNEFNQDDGDPSLYTGAIYMLETLKKELQE